MAQQQAKKHTGKEADVTFNDANQHETSKNKNLELNALLRSKVINTAGEISTNEQNGGSTFSKSVAEQLQKEQSFKKNDLLSSNEDVVDEVNVISALNEKETDENEDVDENSPEINDEPEKVEEFPQKSLLHSRKEQAVENVNVISALNQKDREEKEELDE